MEMQTVQTQTHHINHIATESRPADLKWLGMATDQVLMSRAKSEVRAEAVASPAATVFAGMSSKLSAWKFAENSWRVDDYVPEDTDAE